jgi:hypothetical protein
MPFVVIAVVVIAALVLLSGRARLSQRKCKWRREGFRHGTSSTRWLCMNCRAEAFTWDGQPPKECKRDVRPTQL